MTDPQPRPAPGPRALRLAAAVIALALAGCAHAPADDPHDPLEPVNRGIYRFNETADRYVLRPVAQGYDKVMPDLARTGVRNFFDNLFYPTTILNDLLQGKPEQFARDLCRFVINTTFGVGGLFDVARHGGLTANDEDFGQTLGRWGVGEGWYLVLPFLGPSNNRDLVGRVFDAGSNPLAYIETDGYGWGLGGLDLLETRAGLLPADRFVEQQLDRYIFVRTIYLQSRQAKVYDGNPPAEDYGFDDDFEDPPPVEPAPED